MKKQGHLDTIIQQILKNTTISKNDCMTINQTEEDWMTNIKVFIKDKDQGRNINDQELNKRKLSLFL